MAIAPELVHRALRVLIVEDEARMRELLMEVVPEMGYPARAAATAEEALRMIQAQTPDIVILDLNLPGMGGMELFEQLRREGANVQVIVLTGFGDLAAAQQAIRLDVAEFLSKPCHLRDIELALERARRRREGAAQQAAAPAETPAAKATTLAEAEYRQILAALRRHDGNKTAAAEELGISRRTLHYRLAEYRERGKEIGTRTED
ncbi:MAG: DNA-binding response regulator [Tepidisphaeraceae bacterium]